MASTEAEEGGELWFVHVKRLLLCAAYIVTSGCLIRFNKYLMHPDRFNYAHALPGMHMLVSSVLCFGFYLVCPKAFPGMEASRGRRLEVLKWSMPISMSFSVALFCSNKAYLYANVSFLQFMKEANVIIVFLMAVAAGLQDINRLRLLIVVWVLAGATLAASGEIEFNWIGLQLQLASQLAESSRIVMGEVLLGGGGVKLDPLSFTLYVAPCCFCWLFVGMAFSWDAGIIPAAIRSWHLLLPNAVLAFVLNVIMASVIKEVSGVGFVLAGVIKDVVLVVYCSFIAGEKVMPLQCAGFSLSLIGVFVWTYMKAMPNSPFVQHMEALVGLEPRQAQTAKKLKVIAPPVEATHLLKSAKASMTSYTEPLPCKPAPPGDQREGA